MKYLLAKVQASMLGAICAVLLCVGTLIPQAAFAQSAGGSGGVGSGDVIHDTVSSAAGNAAGCGALFLANKAALALGAGASAGAAAGATAGAIASGFPVHDNALFAIQTASLGTQYTVSNAASTQDTVKCALDSLAWTAAKVAIQSITRSTVNWINSGFQGSPAFVTDLKDNLNTLADTVANNFFQQLNHATVSATGFNLVSPFQDQITQKVRSEYYQATGSLLGLNQYDLSGHSSDPKAFLNGNFSRGGFNAFFSASQNPANNPFDSYLAATNALWNQIDAAAEQRKNEYLSGKGFLPWKGSCSNPSTPKSATSLTRVDPCFGKAAKTPGSVIESQLEGVLGTGIRQLELANSINQIVGALVGQLVNQVLGSGGLSGVSQPAAGGGPSYLSQATSQSQYSAAISGASGAVTQTIANDLSRATAYRDNWQKILDAANAAKQTCGERSDIATVITQASAGVARGNAVLSQEGVINKEIQDMTSTTAVDAGSKITAALAKYDSYLNSSSSLSSDDILYAAAQSSPTSADASTTPSLYTQMVTAKNTCATHT